MEIALLFRQLEYFVTVAEVQHFSKAAKICHVSQPALSAAITGLERELDVKLIERGRSFIALTPEGERLLRWAERILREQSAIKAELRSMGSELGGTLRLGTIPTVGTSMSLILSAFCSNNPTVKIESRNHLPTSELYRRLANFEIDAAIVPMVEELADNPELEFTPIYSETCTLVARSKMLPISVTGNTHAPQTLRWSEAARLPLAVLTSDMRVRQIIDSAFAEAGVRPNIRLETDSVSTLLAQASNGVRACIIPHTWLWPTPPIADLHTVKLIYPTVTTRIAVVVNSKKNVSPLARALAQSASNLALDDFFTKRLGNAFDQ